MDTDYEQSHCPSPRPMNPWSAFRLGALALGLSLLQLAAQPANSPTRAAVDLSALRPANGLTARQDGALLRLTWPISAAEEGSLTLNLDAGQPLIEALGARKAGTSGSELIRRVDPFIFLTEGERDLQNPAGWVAFFDNPPLRAYRTFAMTIDKKSVRVVSEGSRTIVTVGNVTVGSFKGVFQFTLFRQSALVFTEAVVQTQANGRAILYDAGLLSGGRPSWKNDVWLGPKGALQRAVVDVNRVATPLAVAQRTLVAEGPAGSVAAFPPPHQYFYPLDFATNLGFALLGSSGGEWPRGYGFGIHQPPAGDKRWVPWFNAPPGTEQRLGIFYLLTSGEARVALDEVARFTRHDRFKALPGFHTFTSHFHHEHTLELMRKRQDLGLPTAIPDELKNPDMIRTFKARGVDIVHLAEFHNGETPGMPVDRRLLQLKTLHDECARLSDNELLLLPGEEPNVHLGGHWLSFFPKPVYWVLNRAAGKPFSEDVPGYGKVYHVGSPADVLKLMESENGLMWTAHARIKGSRTFPDVYRDTPFFHSDRFLGAAWKSMPADLSLPRLGSRVLDLGDDFANWGERKYILGEVDIFRVESDMETYAHMNINYLKLDRVPRYGDGWQPVLDVLRAGKFFVTTGEMLIPEFTVGGKESGETIARSSADANVELRAKVEWTFPPAFAEIVSGDGKQVYRQRVELNNEDAFGTRELRVPIDLTNRTWVRFEIWDAARNGAFTQPVWVK
jgi:hypothetical protein